MKPLRDRDSKESRKIRIIKLLKFNLKKGDKKGKLSTFWLTSLSGVLEHSFAQDTIGENIVYYCH
jgi:hypothetical protein